MSSTPARLRRPLIAAVAALTVTAGVLSVGASRPPDAASAASTGQTTAVGLLPKAASDFSNSATGWTPITRALAQRVTNVGHRGLGALVVRSSGHWSGAASPRFSVTAGDRYAATAWVLAQHAVHAVGLSLRFYDTHGRLVAAGTQSSQGVADSTSRWTLTPAVMGFAPAGAVSAQVLFLNYDGPANDTVWLDDVTVARTSGAVAPLATPLRVSGTRLLDHNGRAVTLRGMNLSGLEVQTDATITPAVVDAAHAWGANMVRIALAEDYALPNSCGYNTAAYLARIDSLVREATKFGMVALLDLHTNSVVPCTQPKPQKMPDSSSVDFWRLMATRYKANPLVAFDLYNEPHAVSNEIWHSGGAVTTANNIPYQAPGMQTLYDTVRSVAPTNLVVATGINWGNNPPALPITGATNLVYGIHAYTCPGGMPASGARCYPGPHGNLDPNGVLDRWTKAARTLPVIVSEFGWPDTNDGRYNANLISQVNGRHWTGWSVWAFTGNTKGMWNLVKDTGPLNDPSVGGMTIMMALRTG